MSKYKMIFKANDINFIEALLPYQEQELEGCEQIILIFHHNQTYYTIGQYDCISTVIDTFHNVLELALNNQFHLHPSIIRDIGYLTNEYFHDSNKEVFIRSTKSKNWIGMNYLISSSRESGMWIYNKDSRIFLQIAPVYKWHFIDPEEDEDYISYEEFIKSYKPHFTLELSKNTVQQWLDKTKELLAIMRQNYEKYEKLAQESIHNEGNKI